MQNWEQFQILVFLPLYLVVQLFVFEHNVEVLNRNSLRFLLLIQIGVQIFYIDQMCVADGLRNLQVEDVDFVWELERREGVKIEEKET